MDNAYICNFINSRDIRNHLREIDYRFSVPEYAYLIWQSRNHSVEQRHKEWKQLINSTETCMIKTSKWKEDWDLHKTIHKYMDVENQLIARIMATEDGAFYQGEFLEDNGWNGGDCFFTAYDKAYSYAMEYANEMPLTSFRIRKNYIDNSSHSSSIIEAVFNGSGEMMEIDLWGNQIESFENYDIYVWNETFNDMWFDIPIPFHPGDLVCDCFNHKPFVLTTTVPWSRNEHPEKHKTDTLQLTQMDMTASGYSLDEKALTMQFDWLDYLYLNLEFYENRLEDEQRLLQVYSLFKKKKINGDTLAKLTQLITSEAQASRYYHELDYDFEPGIKEKICIGR